METEEKEEGIEEACDLTVDLSQQTLKKIERAKSEHKLATTLILDCNEIQKLENLDAYKTLKKLSAASNHLFRMYGVSFLIHLETLDLSDNSLVTIEGLKDLKDLKYLFLAKNKIKSIEHLNHNLKLEKIDLSDNNICHLSDISFLQNLQELRLGGNKISNLNYGEKKLPRSIEILTLDKNLISDLNEISHLAELTSLKEFSFENNPCLKYADHPIEFNYRPFVKNWCSSLIVLDNCPLDDIECLKAEWLYSQGRGRSFRSGEHAALVEYLTTVCPKKAEENDEEDDKKLKLILSKAQQHQQQLREQLSLVNISSPESQKSLQSRKKKVTGLSDRMATSFQDSSIKVPRQSSEIMTLSLDSAMMRNSPPPKTYRGVSDTNQTPLQTSTTFIPIPDSLISPDVSHSLYPFASGTTKSFSTSCRTSRSSSRNSVLSTPDSKRRMSSALSWRMNNDNSSPDNKKKKEKLDGKGSRSNTPSRRSVLARSSCSPGGSGYGLRESERKYKETSEEEDSESVPFKGGAMQRRANQRAMRCVTKKESRGKKESRQRKEEEGKRERKEVEESRQRKEEEESRERKEEESRKRKEEEESRERKEEEERRKEPDKKLMESDAWKAAVCIQRHWRGYRARNLSGEVLTVCKSIQMNRMQDYITKVVKDMEATRVALEGNRKLQVLQMQAINALWRKMMAFQPSESPEKINENKTRLQKLMETCSNLNKQVEGLHEMVKAMQKKSTGSNSLIPIGTQTEIVAVRTPQDETRNNFPYVEADVSHVTLSSDSTKLPADPTREDVQASEESTSLENGTLSVPSEPIFELFTNISAKEAASKEFCSNCPEDSSEERGNVLQVERLIRPCIVLSEPLRDILKHSTKEKEAEDVEEKREVQNGGCNS